MKDKETLAAYATAARRYAEGFTSKKDTNQEEDYAAFTAHLPAGGRVLDFGCGPAHWAARFAGDGYVATALDASPEMAALALEKYGLTVRVGAFEDLTDVAVYDGIWANFSLLHAPRADFAGHLDRIHRAIKPGGVLSLGMKLGQGEGRDSLGRFYTYYSQEDLEEALRTAGFTPFRSRRGNGEGLAGGVETFVVLSAHA
ncbi:MAG: class I SAM-dependent methyltransferase [Pelagimonas sp.]|jgi:SAM-dependent methyltransferase|nr:class I SAM-dependent methyltransferase [Pelagimonas sp.]